MEHEKLIKYIFTSIITDDETFMNDIAFGRLNNLEYTSLWYDIYQVFFFKPNYKRILYSYCAFIDMNCLRTITYKQLKNLNPDITHNYKLFVHIINSQLLIIKKTNKQSVTEVYYGFNKFNYYKISKKKFNIYTLRKRCELPFNEQIMQSLQEFLDFYNAIMLIDSW